MVEVLLRVAWRSVDAIVGPGGRGPDRAARPAGRVRPADTAR